MSSYPYNSEKTVHEPAANTAAVATLAAVAGNRHQLQLIAWSYDGTPTGGSLTITDGGTTIFKVDITSAGPGFFPVEQLKCNVNSQVVVTLAAGGAGVSGIINVHHWVDI